MVSLNKLHVLLSSFLIEFLTYCNLAFFPIFLLLLSLKVTTTLPRDPSDVFLGPILSDLSEIHGPADHLLWL